MTDDGQPTDPEPADPEPADPEQMTDKRVSSRRPRPVYTPYNVTEKELRRRRTRRHLRRRRRIAIAVFLLIFFIPAIYSWASTMGKPSSLPMGIRTIEWVRENHGAWFVNTVERYYYTWTAPKKGGPGIKKIPTVGLKNDNGRPKPKPSEKPAYQPPDIKPVIRPGLANEGVWREVVKQIAGAPPILVTDFRPEPDYPSLVAYVAWIDTTRTQLALYPGRYEPPSGSPRGPMMVPPGQRWRLLATFNSGFTYGDGRGGFSINGIQYTPLTTGFGTLVGYSSGKVDIITWHGGAVPGDSIMLARQNLPLIVDDGEPNPDLDTGQGWGYTLGGAVRVWRSAVGVDKMGDLIYLAAPAQTAPSIAQAIAHAGAVRAIELDINTEWPTFNTYGQGGGQDVSMLVPTYMQPSTRYLYPDDRDFFAVYSRLRGPITGVPLQ